MKKIDKFENKIKIAQAIERIVRDTQTSYMDAALHYANVNDLEIEYVAEMLTKNDFIRSKIEEEAEDLNFLKRKSRLPI